MGKVHLIGRQYEQQPASVSQRFTQTNVI